MNIPKTAPFMNDPFVVVAEAFRRLYDLPYVAQWAQHSEQNEDEYGSTVFDGDAVPSITVYAEHPVNVQIETFAHELAHVAAGIEHGHDEVFQKTLAAIKAMYNIVYDEMLENPEITTL